MTKSKNIALSKNFKKPFTPDPLYIIFEQHLFNFQDEEMDRNSFIKNVIQDYLSFIGKMGIAIPPSLKASVVEELATLISTMLMKKIYGCLSPQEYQKTALSHTKRTAKSKYSRLKAG